MNYPALIINKKKLEHNIKLLQKMCKENGVEFCAVTKSFCAYESIVNVYYNCGVKDFADTRIKNLQRINHIGVVKWLLRSPMMCEIKNTVKYADISLNSEIETIIALSNEAKNQKKMHKIVLMVDLGDLREGVLPKDVLKIASKIINLNNVELYGLGVNFNCFGGVIPTTESLTILNDLAKEIETKFSIKLSIISGGNSGSIHFLQNGEIKNNKLFNHLRIGEAILLGSETSFRNKIESMYTDVFCFKAQIIELKTKPSLPSGLIGTNAFGEVVKFIDRGDMLRSIVACGRQDVEFDKIIPTDKDIEILGQSSDHTILNLTNCTKKYEVGDTIDFSISYSSLLSLFTSEYVEKILI